MASRSPPAQKWPPAPRSTSTRQVWSSRTRPNASSSSSIMAWVSALRRSGRFSVSRATAPSRVERDVGVVGHGQSLSERVSSQQDEASRGSAARGAGRGLRAAARTGHGDDAHPRPHPVDRLLHGRLPAGRAGPAARRAGYEAIRISRNRYWGQPVTLDFIKTLSEKVRAAGQAPLYIGDIGQPRGGPAPSGHASHQTGLDADIWFERQPGPRLAPAQRENPRLRSLVRADDSGIDDSVFSPAARQPAAAGGRDAPCSTASS